MFLSYLLATERAIQDAHTNRWSYINLLDIINIPSDLDFTIQDIVVAAKVTNIPDGNLKADVEIVSPSNIVIQKVHLEGPLHTGDANLTAFFSSLKFSEIGRYTFRITCNGKLFEDSQKYHFQVNKA